MSSLLSIKNLGVNFDTPRGSLEAVRGVDIEIPAGRKELQQILQRYPPLIKVKNLFAKQVMMPRAKIFWKIF